jgi:hypothetical protein
MPVLQDLARRGEKNFASSAIYHAFVEMLHHGHLDEAIKATSQGDQRLSGWLSKLKSDLQ